MKRLFILLIGIALIATLPSVPAWADLIRNGGFEYGTEPPIGGFRTLGAGSGNLADWYIGFRGIDWIGDYWQPYDGARSLDLNGNAPGWIAQTLNTTPGTAYRVSFALAGNPDGGDPIKDLLVTALGIGSRSYSFDTTGKSRSAMGWSVEDFDFTARSNWTTLIFASAERDPYGPAIDGIEANPAVPLPPALWLLGSGLIGLVVIRRRRTR